MKTNKTAIEAQNKTKTEKTAERRLWMRLGVTLRVTEAEEAVIFANDGSASALLRNIIVEGRFAPDGDTYIPGPVVEEYNETYGTGYEVGDVEFNL